MPELLLLRPLTEEETRELRTLAQSQKVEARLRDRARICWLSHDGNCVREIVAQTAANEKTVRRGITRFNTQGVDGLRDGGRSTPPRTSVRSWPPA